MKKTKSTPASPREGRKAVGTLPSATSRPVIEESTPPNEEGLTYDRNSGLLLAATQNNVLHALTSQLSSGGFLSEFLMTFKLFMSPVELLTVLLDKLSNPDAVTDVAVTRVRVVNILKTWIKEYPMDWTTSEDIYTKLTEFMEAIKDANLSKLMGQVKIGLAKTDSVNRVAVKDELLATPGKANPMTITRIASQTKSLKEVAPQDFAEQLTLIDQEIFEQVSAADLLIWATVPVERATKAPRLSVFIEKYNEVMMWVVSAIVCEPEQQERTALIRRFIDIAAALQDIGSFNLFCAIMAGLTHPCITFLNGSWTAVIDPHKTTFDTLKAATSSDGHYKNLATQMSLFKGPYIPFLGGYISDIQKIHESEQTKTKQGDLEIINYGKLRRLFDVASTIRQSRNAGAYIAKPKANFRQMFAKLAHLEEEATKDKLKELKEGDVETVVAAKPPSWLVSRKNSTRTTSSSPMIKGPSGSRLNSSSEKLNLSTLTSNTNTNGSISKKDSPSNEVPNSAKSSLSKIAVTKLPQLQSASQKEVSPPTSPTSEAQEQLEVLETNGAPTPRAVDVETLVPVDFDLGDYSPFELPEEIEAKTPRGDGLVAPVIPSSSSIPLVRLSSSSMPKNIQAGQKALSVREKEEIRRTQIVQEILSTEKSYTDFMTILVEDGIMPLKKQNILSDSDIKAIFVNVDGIMAFHKVFHGELEKVISNWRPDSKIGALFVQYSQYFKVYTEFVNNFDKSNAALGRCLQKVAKFKEHERNVVVKKTGKLDYATLLIMPVQRLPRYVLLLKDLKRKTKDEHPDFQDLKTAIRKMKDMAAFVNVSKKDNEMNQRSIELKKKITGYDGTEFLKPDRRLIRELDANLLSLKGASKIGLILWNDVMMFVKDLKGKLVYYGQLNVPKMQVKIVTERDIKRAYKKQGKDATKDLPLNKLKHFLEITYIDYTFYLSLKSDKEVTQFLDDLKTARLESLSRFFKRIVGNDGSPAPDPREFVGYCMAGNTLFVHGGSMKNIFFDDLWGCNLETYKWDKVSVAGTKPPPVAEHTLSHVNGKIYLWGGQNAGLSTSDMYMLDLQTMNWEKIATQGEVPGGRTGHTASVFGDCIYYFGGNFFESIHSQKFFNTLYIFNTTTRTWSLDPADTSKIVGRCHHAAEVLGEKMYIYGGKSKDNKDLNDIYVYDFTSRQWIPNFEVSGVVPTARNHAGSAVYDQNLIIYGGSSTTDVFNTVFVFNTDTSTWKLLTLPLDMPARKGHTMSVTLDIRNTDMVVFGGRILNAEDCMEYQNDVWIIKDIGKYIASVDEGHKTLQKLRERVGKIGAYSVSQRTPEISSSFNFVHKMHVDQDFRWDGNAVDIFKFKEKLGEGGFGEVFRAVQGDTKFELAIKVVKNTNKSSPEAEQLAKEMELLKKCRHPSIVQYFGFSQVNPTDSWIMMEVCDMGSLRDVMRSTGKPLTERQVGVVVASILQGLSYLHGLNIVHRDIKGGNILLTNDGTAKLSDFGLAISSDLESNTISGSVPFLAPEVFQDKKYSEKSDIWALGVTVIELLENIAPFDKLTKAKRYSAELQDFVSVCLKQNAPQRLNALQLLSHPFVTPFMKTDQKDVLKDLIEAARRGKTKKMVRESSSEVLLSRATTTYLTASEPAASRPPSGNLASAADVNLLKEQNAALEKRTVQLEGELADMKTKYADLLARVAALETKK